MLGDRTTDPDVLQNEDQRMSKGKTYIDIADLAWIRSHIDININ